jgi:hypothetical protein
MAKRPAQARSSSRARQGPETGATAKEQVGRVRGEVVEQGRSVVADARSQVEAQANAQVRRLADGLAGLGEQVRALNEGRPEDAGTLAPYVSNAAEAVYDAADRVYTVAANIDERGLGGVLEDVQAFARRRPGAFLVGAAIAGFGLGRAVRASSSEEPESPSSARGRSR